MYAIFKAKGKQWRAEPGATLKLPSLEAEPGERVVFDDVLLAEGDGRITVGRPAIEGASVATEVVRHGRGPKIVVFKMKRRKGYRRKQGHRQDFTEVKVVDITLGGGSGKKASASKKKAGPEPEAKAAPAPKAEAPAKEEKERAEAPAKKAAAEAEEPTAEAVAEAFEAVDITPAAAELARESALDVSGLEGTGKDGRILKSDVEKAIKQRDEEG